MADSLGTIREQVRMALAEATASQWEDDDLNTWINDGAQDIARRAEVLQDRYDVTVVAATSEYTLPTTVIRVHRVEWRPTGQTQVYPLEYRDFQNMDGVWWTNQSQQGTPMWFTMWGFPPSLKLVLFPVPNVGGVAKVFYYRLPTRRYGDTDTLELPEGWSDLLVHYCEYRALRRDRDQRWQEAKALYDEGLQAMIGLTRRWSDQQGMIDNTQPLPAWLTAMGDY